MHRAEHGRQVRVAFGGPKPQRAATHRGVMRRLLILLEALLLMLLLLLLLLLILLLLLLLLMQEWMMPKVGARVVRGGSSRELAPGVARRIQGLRCRTVAAAERWRRKRRLRVQIAVAARLSTRGA